MGTICRKAGYRITTAAIFLALALAACGGSNAPATIQVHGTLGNGIGNSGTCVSGGDQVRITSVSGTVLATPSLAATAVPKKVTAAGVTVTLDVYPFSATVPAEPKYGISTGSMPVYYVTERQFEMGVDLSC